jgi:hypothetical protein
MRNAGLSEARCQNEVSESKAPAASSVTSKMRRSKRLTEFLQAGGVPTGSATIAARRRACFKVDPGPSSRLRGRSIKHADNFEYRQTGVCERKSCEQSGVARQSKKCARRCPECLRSFVVRVKKNNELNNGRQKYEYTDNGGNRPALRP